MWESGDAMEMEEEEGRVGVGGVRWWWWKASKGVGAQDVGEPG